MSNAESHALWRRYLNPEYIDLLEALGFGRTFVWAEGCTLRDDAGREYTDFLAGFGVHNVGHNHSRVVAALREALEARPASMLNVDAPLAVARLAERLASATHPSLCRTTFANSGAEAVEVALKAARAATGRRGIVACERAYHGLSFGTLPLLGDEEARSAFRSGDDDVTRVPFGDAAALKDACARRKPSAFIVEPLQAEGGMHVAPAGYLRDAARICREHGVLLVIDEIQTGLSRTGRLFATPFNEVQPDALIAGKALSGGLVPVAAALLNEELWRRSYGKPDRCRLNSSTFAGGHLAMAVGWAVLEVLERDGLAAQASATGAGLLDALKRLAGRHPAIRDVRGEGLLLGVELQPPSGLLPKLVPEHARQGLFGHVISARLLEEHGFLTCPCSLAPHVLRIEPPLVVSGDECGKFCVALDEVLKRVPSYGSALWSAVWQRWRGARD